MSQASTLDHAQFARALLDPASACPAGLVAHNGSDPSRRLAVHRNNVLVSLVEALADGFPVVRQLVGEAFFRATAAVFVRQSPPTSPMLAQYGERFPAFIEGFAPAASVPYLADVARLEFARVSAYHAADAAVVSAAEIAAALAMGEGIERIGFNLHPSVSLIASAHAVVTIWAAHQTDADPVVLEIAGAQAALVVRTMHDDVVVLRLSDADHVFIRALRDGETFAAAAAQANQHTESFDLQSALALLLEHGAIAAIRHP